MGFAERYVRFAWRKPWLVLACTALVTAGGGALALRLHVSADLRDLLPEGTPSVRAMDEALARLGSTDSLTIALQSPDRLANRRFLEAVAAEVQRWPEHPFLLWRLDVGYFLERRLYYVDLPDLVTVRDDLQRRMRYEKIHHNPAYIDLSNEPAPVVIPEKMKERYRDRLGWREGKEDSPGAGHSGALSDNELFLEGAAGAQDGAGSAGGPGRVTEEPRRRGVPVEAANDIVSALVIRFPGSAVDLAFARRVAQRAECVVGARPSLDCSEAAPSAGAPGAGPITVVSPAAYNRELRVEVTGGLHQRMRESEVIARDAVWSSLSSLLMIALIVAVSFRRLRAVLFVMLPLVVGVVLSLGLAWLLLGTLNVISAFTFAVLIGLGVDFGIHIGRRYDEERRSGTGALDASLRAVTLTGRGILGAGVTTAVAFVALLFARFRGFRDFGLLSSVSVPIAMLAAMTLFPALVSAGERVRSARYRPMAAAAPSGVRRTRPLSRWPVLALFVTLVVVGAGELPRLEFEYDFSKLMADSAVTEDRIASGAATRGYSGSPAVALAPTREAARKARDAIQEGDDENAPFLKGVFSYDSFVPPDQQAKRHVLQDIMRLLDEPSFGFVEDDMSDEEYERLSEVRAWLSADRVSTDDAGFPGWARRLFTEKDPRWVGRVVYLMPRISTSDARAAGAMQRWLAALHLPRGTVVAASGFILADVVRSVLDDAWLVVGLTLAGILLTIAFLWPSARIVVAIVVPLVGGFVVMFGLLAALGIKITFYSVAALPVMLGTGVDGSIHFYERWRQEPSGSVGLALRSVGPPILLSALTSVVAFGSLMTTSHGGLFSLGLVSAVGLSSVVSVTVLGTFGFLLTGVVPTDPGRRQARRRLSGLPPSPALVGLVIGLAALLPVRTRAQQTGMAGSPPSDESPTTAVPQTPAGPGGESHDGTSAANDPEVPEPTTSTRVSASDLVSRSGIEVNELLPASGLGTAGGPVAPPGLGTWPWIRGLAGPGHLLLILDGIPLEDPVTGQPIFEAVPLAAADEVDLLRGPSSGQDAAYGTASVADVTTEPGASRPGAAGLIEGGSSESALATLRLAGDTAWLEAAGALETYAVAENWLREGFDDGRYRGFLRIDLGRNRELSAIVTAGYALWRMARTASLAPNDPRLGPLSDGSAGGERDTYNVHVAARWQPIPDLALDVTTAWLQSTSDACVLPADCSGPNAALAELVAHRGTEWRAGGSARWQLAEEATLGLGLQYARDSGTWSGSAAGGATDVGELASAWLATPYANLVFEPEGGGVRVTGDLKLDWHSTTGAAMSGGVGVAFMPTSGTTLRLSTSDGAREPTLLELSLPDGDVLTAERLFQVEAGIEQSISSLGWARITAFTNRVSSPIVFRTSTDPLAGCLNGEEYRTTGLEIEFRLAPIGPLEFRFGYTRSWNDGLGTGALGPAFPANILGFALLAGVPLGNWSLDGRLELQVVGFERLTASLSPDADSSVPSYATADLRLCARRGLLALFLEVRNLWNAPLPAASGMNPRGIEALLGVGFDTGDPVSWAR